MRNSRFILSIGTVQAMTSHSFVDIIIGLMMGMAVFDTSLVPCKSTVNFLKKYGCEYDHVNVSRKASRLAYKVMTSQTQSV